VGEAGRVIIDGRAAKIHINKQPALGPNYNDLEACAPKYF
jgi:hypothetical protein